jgi:hypothetical protein
MHENANKDAERKTKSRTTSHETPALPGNQGEFSERHLILRINEAIANNGLALRVTRLSFILVDQVDSSSPVFGTRKKAPGMTF